jgi:hypothetical protein
MGDDLGDEFYDVPRQSEDDSSDADDGIAQSTKKRPLGSDSNDADDVDVANEAPAELAAAKKKKKKKKKPRTEASSGSAIGGASADALAAAFMGLYLKEVCHFRIWNDSTLLANARLTVPLLSK